MHRTAATLLGLTLIVFSIWYNATHFPLEWEAALLVQSKPSRQLVEASAPDATNAVVCEKSAEEQDAIASIADAKPDAKPASEVPKAKSPVIQETESPVLLVNESKNPLVPVAQEGWPSARTTETEFAAGVRRLPSVDRILFDRIDRDRPSTFSGAMPEYPTTRIP